MNTNLKTIAVIICYYGTFPWYVRLFLHSCKFNPTIDFLLITDQETVPDCPLNVKFIKSSLESFKKTATEKMGFPVVIDRPYKLTDFKPAYGFIFEELLQKYDYWAHADLDVVYGNIRFFLTPGILSNDVVSVRHDHIAGVFTAFKNNFDNNRLFMQSKDYRYVMMASEHCCFDETNFLYEAFRDPGNAVPQIDRIESMSHLVLRLKLEKKIRAYFDLHILEGAFDDIRWDKGKLTYQEKFQVMLFHLLVLKNRIPDPKLPEIMPDIIQFGTNYITV